MKKKIIFLGCVLLGLSLTSCEPEEKAEDLIDPEVPIDKAIKDDNDGNGGTVLIPIKPPPPPK